MGFDGVGWLPRLPAVCRFLNNLRPRLQPLIRQHVALRRRSERSAVERLVARGLKAGQMIVKRQESLLFIYLVLLIDGQLDEEQSFRAEQQSIERWIDWIEAGQQGDRPRMPFDR